MFDFIPQPVKDAVSLFADVAGLVGCVLSVILFFTREGVRKTLQRRHMLPGSIEKLRALETQFREAFNESNRTELMSNARGTLDLAKRMQKEKLITLERTEIELLTGVARGTSQEFRATLVLIRSCIERVKHAQETDNWSR